MIGVVIPAHNEAVLIGPCISSVMQAARSPMLNGEPVQVVVVLDDCSDATGIIARSYGAVTLSVALRNVGQVRALGAQLCLDAGARWLAFTDADTVVAHDWLAVQLQLQADVVCGTVLVDNWGAYGARMAFHFAHSYTDAEGHRHIHGANLGVSARAYQQVGGFAALRSSEDVALVQALQAAGVDIAWSARPRVVTSARKLFRAPGGFGARLLQIDVESSHITPALLAA